MTAYERYRADKLAQAQCITRMMLAEPLTETATERAARTERERKAGGRKISEHLGAKSTVKKYAHGQDCRRWMTGAEYLRDWAGSRAVVVRDGDGDEPRMLVHLCGIKAGESCAIGAVYNRIPDSRVSRSDTTDFIHRCHAHKSGYVHAALRDVKTRYQLGKAVTI